MGGISGALGGLWVEVGARIDGFEAAMAEVGDRIRAARAELEPLSRIDFSDVALQLGKVGAGLTALITAPIIGIGAGAVAAATSMDSLVRGLTAVSSTSEDVNKELDRLQEVAKLPGLGFQDAIQGSTRLQAAGFSAKEAEGALQAFGNALATVGKGKADLSGVTLALGQIASKGKVSAEEINQLAERIPQIRVAMQGAFGTADTKTLQKMEVGAFEFVNKVVAELSKLPKVTGGIQNDFENFSDAVFKTKAALGQALLPIVHDALGILTDLVGKVKEGADWFKTLDPPVQKAALAFVAVVAAAGPLLLSLAGVSAAIGTIGSLIGTGGILGGLGLTTLGFLGWAAAIPLVLAALLALGTWVYSNWAPITAVVKQAWDGISEIWSTAWGSITGKITGIWSKFLSDSDSMWKPVAKFFQDIWNDVDGPWHGIWSALATWLKGVWDGIAGAGDSIWGAAKKTVGGVWDQVEAAWRSAWGTTETWLLRQWTDIATTGVSVWGAAKNATATAWDTVATAWASAWNAATGVIASAWDEIKNTATSAWGTIVSSVSNVWSSVAGAWQSTWRTISSSITGVWEAIASTASTAWDTAASVVAGVWGAVGSSWRGVWNPIQSWIIGVWQAISSAATTGWESSKSSVASVWDSIPSAWQSIWTGLQTWIVGSWQSIANSASNLWEGAKSFLGGIWDAIPAAWQAVWNGVQGWIIGVWDGIAAAATRTWKPTVDFLANVWSGIGEKMTGVWEGIKNSLTGVWQSIASTAESVWGGIVKNFQTFIEWAGKIPGVNKLMNLDAAWASAKKLGDQTGVTTTALMGQAGAHARVADEVGKAEKAYKPLIDKGGELWQLAKLLEDNYKNANAQIAKHKEILRALGNSLPTVITLSEDYAQAMNGGKGNVKQWKMVTLNEEAIQSIDKVIAESVKLKDTKVWDGFDDSIVKAKDSTIALDKAVSTLGSNSTFALQKQRDAFQEAYDTLRTTGIASTSDVAAALRQLDDANLALTQSISGIGDAYRTLGITSSDQLSRQGADAAAAYEKIRTDSSAKITDIEGAWVRMEEARQAAALAVGQVVTRAEQDELEKRASKLDEALSGHTKRWDTFRASVSGIISGLSADLVKSMFEGGGSWAEKGLTALKQLGEAVVTAFIQPFTDAITKFISGALTDLLSSKGLGGVMDSLKNIGSSIGGIFGGGGSGGVPNITGIGGDNPLGQIPGGISGGGGAAGAASGAASAGIAGIAGAVGSIAGAISGIIGNFQNAKQETSLNAIEHNTRYSMMFLGERGDGGIVTASLKSAEYLGYLNTSVDTIGKYLSDWLSPANNALQDLSLNLRGTTALLSDISSHTYDGINATRENGNILGTLRDLLSSTVSKVPIVNVYVNGVQQPNSAVELRLQGVGAL